MTRTSLTTLSATLVVLGWCESALAEDAGTKNLARDESSDLPALVRELASAERAVGDGLSASDGCAIACRALDSMRRAKDRICALDAGAACDDARRRTSSAEARVAQSCPCALSDDPPAAKAADMKKPAAAPESATSPGADVASAPQRGGCASCATVGQRGVSPLALGATALFIAAAFARRRRRDGSAQLNDS